MLPGCRISRPAHALGYDAAMSTSSIDIAVEGGGIAVGALAVPAGEGPAPAVVIVHEWWGLNDDMRRVATRLASEGFIALAVDLYGGRAATRPEEALELMQALRTPEAMKVIGAGVTSLRTMPRSNGKVGITGFCLGGAMTLAAACQVSGIDAAAPFYGIPKPEYADYSRVRVPIQGHFGKKDGSIPVERPEAVAAAVRAGGGEMELFLYDAGHAFLREGDPHAYDAESAKLAWSRMLTFFRERLR